MFGNKMKLCENFVIIFSQFFINYAVGMVFMVSPRSLLLILNGELKAIKAKNTNPSHYLFYYENFCCYMF